MIFSSSNQVYFVPEPNWVVFVHELNHIMTVWQRYSPKVRIFGLVVAYYRLLLTWPQSHLCQKLTPEEVGGKSQFGASDQAAEFDELGECVVLTLTKCLFHNCNHVIVTIHQYWGVHNPKKESVLNLLHWGKLEIADSSIGSGRVFTNESKRTEPGHWLTAAAARLLSPRNSRSLRSE